MTGKRLSEFGNTITPDSVLFESDDIVPFSYFLPGDLEFFMIESLHDA